MRHCPFISKESWTGTFGVPLKREDETDQLILDICPKGFWLKHRDYQMIVEMKKWVDRGIMPYGDIGYMELPNKYLEMLELVDAELGYIPKKEKRILGM